MSHLFHYETIPSYRDTDQRTACDGDGAPAPSDRPSPWRIWRAWRSRWGGSAQQLWCGGWELRAGVFDTSVRQVAFEDGPLQKPDTKRGMESEPQLPNLVKKGFLGFSHFSPLSSGKRRHQPKGDCPINLEIIICRGTPPWERQYKAMATSSFTSVSPSKPVATTKKKKTKANLGE